VIFVSRIDGRGIEGTFEPFRRTRLGKRAMMREFTNSTGRWSFVSTQLEPRGIRCLEKVSEVMRRDERFRRSVLRLER
jgi:hypothetical protein